MARTLETQNVEENNKTLQEKARKVLKACHNAATMNASNFDSLLVDLATIKETNAEANELYVIGLRLIDPTSKKAKLKESMQKIRSNLAQK